MFLLIGKMFLQGNKEGGLGRSPLVPERPTTENWCMLES